MKTTLGQVQRRLEWAHCYTQWWAPAHSPSPRLQKPVSFPEFKGIAMLPITARFAMKLLSKRQLKELILYIQQHIQRLENANRFPQANCALATAPVQEWEGLKAK